MADWKTDPVVQFVLDHIQECGLVKSAWLFGSRAKQTATDKSDYDFAFLFRDNRSDSWGSFATFLREKNPRLNTLDLIRFDQVGEDLQKRILQEGIVIYDEG